VAKPKPVTNDGERDPKTQSYVDPNRIAGLQQEVTKACLCERKKDQKAEGECWSPFWKEVNEYRSSGEWATACGPGSSSGIDFKLKASTTSGASMTVITNFGYGACSKDEVATRKAEYEKRAKQKGC
jgi:hypothetical protein